MNQKNTAKQDSPQMCISTGYSKISKALCYVALLFVVFLTACKKDDFTGEVIGLCPVVSTDPTDKAVDVVLGKVITATFNTIMDASTINSSTFIIKQGTTQVLGKVEPTANGAVFTFKPDAPLSPFTTYTGTITNGVKDTLRTAMVDDYVWTFTTIPQITLSSNPSTAGTTAGAGDFAQGSVVTVTATPATGFVFSNWTVSGSPGTPISSNSSFQFPMNGNVSLVANFSPVGTARYAVNISSLPTAGGTTTGAGTYDANTSVTATATPNSGYTFVDWTENGLRVSTSSSIQFNIIRDRTFIANFRLNTAPVVAPLFSTIFGAFGGSAGITNQGINTVINNGSIGTTAAATLITGFHDGTTGDVYTETDLNKGLVTGRIHTAPPPPGSAASFAIASQALAAMNAFYISISPANRPGGTVLSNDQLGNRTLAPGTYKSASGTYHITTGNLTLDAQGNADAVWVFQVPTALTVGVAGPTGARSIILTNGAQAKNVYWYVGTAATINGAGGGTMVGTIITTAGVTFSTAGNNVQTVLNGRALSLVASVTMVNTTINVP